MAALSILVLVLTVAAALTAGYLDSVMSKVTTVSLELDQLEPVAAPTPNPAPSFEASPGPTAPAPTPSALASLPTSSGSLDILLLGSDSREGTKGYGDASKITGQRSDTIMLVHIPADRAKVKVLSIPRDMIVDLPECAGGGTGRINSAMDTSPSCAVKAVRSLTGIDVRHYASVNFTGFIAVVDALGGIDVTLAAPVKDAYAKLNLPAGTSHLDGKTALAYVRARHGLGDGSDLSRIDRQQDFLSDLATKAMEDPAGIPGLAYTLAEHTTMDESLAQQAPSLALSLAGLSSGDLKFTTMDWVLNSDRATLSPGPKAPKQFKSQARD